MKKFLIVLSLMAFTVMMAGIAIADDESISTSYETQQPTYSINGTVVPLEFQTSLAEMNATVLSDPSPVCSDSQKSFCQLFCCMGSPQSVGCRLQCPDECCQ